MKFLYLVLTLILLTTCVSNKLEYKINSEVRSNFLYISDMSKWNAPDYWQTAKETQSTNSGDCEDFAIYEAALLLKQNVNINDMQFSLFKDMLTNEYHLVLLYQGKLLDLDGVKEFTKTLDGRFTFLYNVPILNIKTTMKHFTL